MNSIYLKKIIDEIVSDPRKSNKPISEKWILKNNYKTILVEDECCDDEEKRVSEYCENFNIDKLLFVGLEEGASAKIFTLSPKDSFIMKAQREFPLSSHVFFPPKLEFLYITNGDTYHIWSGPEDFIRFVVPDNPQIVMESLELYLDNYVTKLGKENILKLAKQYRYEN